MVQVTEKPVEFNEDVKEIFGILHNLYKYTLMLNLNFNDFDDKYWKLWDVVEPLFRYGTNVEKYIRRSVKDLVDDVFWRFDIIYDVLDRIIININDVIDELDNLHDKGYLKEEYVKSCIKYLLECKKEITSRLPRIRRYIKVIENMYKEEGLTYDFINGLKDVVNNLRYIDLALSMNIYIFTTSSIGLLHMYATDPPEDAVKKDDEFSWESILILGVIAIALVLVIR